GAVVSCANVFVAAVSARAEIATKNAIRLTNIGIYLELEKGERLSAWLDGNRNDLVTQMFRKVAHELDDALSLGLRTMNFSRNPPVSGYRSFHEGCSNGFSNCYS